MLQNSGKVLDNASPIITSRLAKNIRISVIKTPVLDEDAGVAASIRIVNPRNLSKADFVQSGTATEEMLDFLSACLRYGVSICVAGATSSGKTTVAGWLLSTIPDRKRIFTIEDGSRELQLIRERDGMVTNSVVHTQTRDSENERQRIDQIALLDIALRFNPDIICVGEMRGPEANAAQEAARVGIAVLTTIHSNSSEGTYRRMVSLCKRAVDTPDDTLMGYVTEAYPIPLPGSAPRNRRNHLHFHPPTKICAECLRISSSIAASQEMWWRTSPRPDFCMKMPSITTPCLSAWIRRVSLATPTSAAPTATEKPSA